MIRDPLLSILGCLGFGVLFNIRGRKLLFSSLGGGLSRFVYAFCLHNSLPKISSLLIASIIFSIYSEIFARILKTPSTTLVICAMLPLVPGAGMYYTMYDVVKGNLSSAFSTGLNTLASAGTLALGIILVSTITKILASKKSR